jgi:hypothetical protein
MRRQSLVWFGRLLYFGFPTVWEGSKAEIADKDGERSASEGGPYKKEVAVEKMPGKCAEKGTGERKNKSTICSCRRASGPPVAEEMAFARPTGQAKNRRKHRRFRLFAAEKNQK